MSVIAVKKYKDKIVIGSDQQISFWRDAKENKHETTPIKLHKISDNMIFGSAWSCSESNCMKMFLEHYEPKLIIDLKSVFEMIKQFKDWWKDYGWEEKCENEYLLITNWKIYNIMWWTYIEEVTDYSAIWSWWIKAMCCLHSWVDVEQTLKSVCAYDIYCSEPIILHTVKL